VLTTGEIPAHNHGLTDPGHNHKLGIAEAGDAATAGIGVQSDPLPQYVHVDANFASQSATTGITINNAGGGGAHAMLQPTIVLNKILRVI
jgi:microcystin-dependent protein